MGNCILGESPYKVLRHSLPGSLLQSESDYRDFFQICLVSGEVLISLSVNDSKSTVVSVVQPGEMIHFFHANSVGICQGGAIIFDNIRLTLQYRSTDAFAQVIGTDYDSLHEFLELRPYLISFKALWDLNMSNFLTSPSFMSLTKNQINIIGPLLKLRSARSGHPLKYAQRSEVHNTINMFPTDSGTVIVPAVSNNALGILLSGVCLAIPSGTDLSDTIHATRSKNYAIPPSPGHTNTNRSSTNNSRSFDKKSILGHIREYIGGRAGDYVLGDGGNQSGGSGGARGLVEIFTSELKAELTRIFPGSIFGLEYYLVRNLAMGLDSIVTLDSVIVGYLEPDALKCLFSLDKRFRRVLQRNFLKTVLDSVRPVVPMLSDMEDKGYMVLSSLINLKSFQKDESIYKKGFDSDYSYIVLRGVVKEVEDKNDGISLSIRGSEGESIRFLGYGNLFGEVSLVTDSPYFTSTYATEPSILISINKRAFDRIFNNDKAKLAEIRIRLIGIDIEMQHVINHPTGNKLFFEFLKKELATENIQLVNAVMRYDDMCERLKKEMYKIQSQHAQYAAELRAMKQLNHQQGSSSNIGGEEEDHLHSIRHGTGSATSLIDRSGMNPNNEQSRTLLRSNSYSTHLSSDKSDMPFSIVDYVELVERGIIKRQPSGSGVVIQQQQQQQQQEGLPSSLPNNMMIADPPDNNQVTAFTGLLHTTSHSPKHILNSDDNNNAAALKVVDYGSDENSVTNQSAVSSSMLVKKADNLEDLSLRSRSLLNSSSPDDAVPVAKTTSEGNATIISNTTTTTSTASNLLEEGNHPPDHAEAMFASTHAIMSTASMQSSNGSGNYKISVPTSGPMRRSSFKNSLEQLGLQNTTGAAISANNPEAVSPAVLDAAPADFATLVISQYHKLEKNILELKEVAKNIVEKFIMKGAESEVNIPEKLRIETEARFRAWYSLSINTCLRKLQQNVAHNPKIFQNATAGNQHHFRNQDGANNRRGGAATSNSNMSPNAPNSNMLDPDLVDTPFRADSIDYQGLNMTPGIVIGSSCDDEDFASIFKASKQEIFKLLQNDPFIRWKQTAEFKNFITAIKPYENSENSFHGSAHISTFRRNSFQRVSGGHHGATGAGHHPPARPYRSLLASSSSSSAANLTSTHTGEPHSPKNFNNPSSITEEANYNDQITKLSFQVLANQGKETQQQLTRGNSAAAGGVFNKQPSILEDQPEPNAGRLSTQNSQGSKRGFFNGSKSNSAVAVSG